MSHRIRHTLCVVLAVVSPSVCMGQGILISATGPVNRSMGGAATAAPLEAQGALFWNPATVTALSDDELGFGMAAVIPDISTSSSIPGLAAGTTDAEPGVTPLLNLAWIHRPQKSRTTYGFGLFSAGGFRTNFPASATNPVFLPQSNTPGLPGGLGKVHTQAAFLQITPSIAWQITDRISFGLSPTITIADVIADPFVFDAPDDADMSGAFRYPSGIGTRTHWGGGIQAGIYYEADNGIHLGFSFKSPQWMERLSYHSSDELGRPRTVGTKLNLPMVLSWGAAWSGWDRFVVAADVRYYDYANTDGFRAAGYLPDGSVAGLGWKSVFAVATGVQYQVNDRLFLRTGYTFNQNPIPDSRAFFNVGTPLYYQHQYHLGGSWRLSKQIWLNAAWSYYFENDVTGQIVTPSGPVPGSSVTSRETVHILDVGITVRY